MRELQADDRVRVVILTGAGDKAFVAGADINELAVQTPTTARAFALAGQHVFDIVEGLGKPVIAAINGYALGGGCELAMACTIRLAADTAEIGQPEINLGIIPGYAGSQRLARLVGKGKAMELLLTGAPVSAAEAQRIGLVNRVVGVSELMNEARTLADQLARNAPIAMRYILDAVNRGLEMPFAQAAEYEATLFGLVAATDDMREGTRAFLDKRKPDFKGTLMAAGTSIRTIEGLPCAAGLRVAIVVSRYHDFVTDRLQSGALAALAASGVAPGDITVVRVPGAFEIPSAAQHAAADARFDAVVCLGCLIRGETPHFEYISSAGAHGLTAAAAATGVPMTFGVLTTNSVEEALERAGEGKSNKGWEAAAAAAEMATVIARLRT